VLARSESTHEVEETPTTPDSQPVREGLGEH
jgi:hypothetical protein